MEENNKIVLQAERDRCWASMREQREKLVGIASMKKEPEPFDMMLLFQSLALVLTDIALYEEQFLDIDDNIKKIMQDHSPAGFLQRVAEEKKYTDVIIDKKVSSDKKLDAIEGLRKSLWGYMTLQKRELTEAMRNFESANDHAHFTLLMQCVALIVLEIDLKEEELKMLGYSDNDFPEN